MASSFSSGSTNPFRFRVVQLPKHIGTLEDLDLLLHDLLEPSQEYFPAVPLKDHLLRLGPVHLHKGVDVLVPQGDGAGVATFHVQDQRLR